MGILDCIIIAVIAVCFVLAVIYTAKQTKKGKCVGCGGGCAGCHSGCKTAGKGHRRRFHGGK